MRFWAVNDLGNCRPLLGHRPGCGTGRVYYGILVGLAPLLLIWTMAFGLQPCPPPAYEGLGQVQLAIDDFQASLAIDRSLVSAKEGIASKRRSLKSSAWAE
jgi:hypothetical protein